MGYYQDGLDFGFKDWWKKHYNEPFSEANIEHKFLREIYEAGYRAGWERRNNDNGTSAY